MSVELARKAFIRKKVEKLLDDSLVVLVKEAATMHPTKLGVALRMLTQSPTGEIRIVEGALALQELLESAAVDIAKAEWLEISKSIPLREAA